MAFTDSNLGLRDREFAKFGNGLGTGSSTYVNVAVSGNIIIGSVSATVDSIFLQSGNALASGTTYVDATQTTSPWVVSGTSTIGSQASLYTIMCGISSGTTDVVPLLCTADGYLLTTATA